MTIHLVEERSWGYLVHATDSAGPHDAVVTVEGSVASCHRCRPTPKKGPPSTLCGHAQAVRKHMQEATG